MKYSINQTNYCDFGTFGVQKLPGRSYFIPYPTREAADNVTLKEKRYGSEKVQCLNGDWDFRFYPKPKELPEELDTDEVSFETIDVPSCWQFRGYDRPFYVNIRYQFPYHPPVIPTTEKVGKVFTWMGADQGIRPRWKDPGEEYNFVGVYREKIEIADPDKHTVISFLGVSSCIDLYVNGAFAGYSEGSHNTAEFDLTGKLNAGENELLAVVRRWCTGTYLEDQDMFRNNGIFRDVLLRISEAKDIYDINAVTVKTGDKYALTLSAETLMDTEVTFTVSGHGMEETKTALTYEQKAEVTFEDLDVTEWNVEDPVLYDVYYETETCCVKERIGFRTVEIQGDLFLVNGKKLKLHGVNHHDTDPKNGYTMSPDDIERDVKLCKEFNIDTIRTSHYPPDPLLLEFADELGVYVVDENDLETHGTFAHQFPPTYNSISHDPKWRLHYLDRITRLYQRDKVRSNTSIIMWSLGNEAGGFRNTDEMYAYLKEHSTLPVHYESAVHCKRVAYDVASDMYPPASKLAEIGKHAAKQKEMNDRPYFLCEYAHAMGVGPGNTEAYWKEIYRYDNLLGGCVWEMVDHAVLHEDGSYTYGGDHGEWEHDGNFCVDGLFYPDRRPSTGAKLIRFIYRPIRVSYIADDRFEIFNTTAFSEGSRYELTFRWNDGTEYVCIPEVAPLNRVEVTIPLGQEVSGTVRAIVEVTDTKTGRSVSEEEVVIKETVPDAASSGPIPSWAVVENGWLTITLPDGGKLTSELEGTKLYRVPTDNDKDLRFRNDMAKFADQTDRLLRQEKTENGCKVTWEIRNKKGRYLVTDTYEGAEDGLLVESTIHSVSKKGIIPRFGKSFRLEESFDDVEYTGRAGESYADMKEQFPIRTVQCKVEDMTEPNIRPQESGNRCDCTEVSLSDGTSKVTITALGKPFELSVKPYRDRELLSMKHREDEKRTGTYVTIQAFQEGIGTGSCGPAVAPEFQFSADRDYTLKFLIKVGAAE